MKQALYIIITAITLCITTSCLQNDGYIGELFGQWRLESIEYETNSIERFPEKSVIGDTSRSTSIRPSSINHLKDFVCTSTRSGISSVDRVLEKLFLMFWPSLWSLTLIIKTITPFKVINSAAPRNVPGFLGVTRPHSRLNPPSIDKILPFYIINAVRSGLFLA